MKKIILNDHGVTLQIEITIKSQKCIFKIDVIQGLVGK